MPTLVDAMPVPSRRMPWTILWHAARVARWARRRGVQVIHCNEHDVYPFAAVLRQAKHLVASLPASAEREELTQLRRENRRLKEEREILSKAAAWFATESGPSKRSSGS